METMKKVFRAISAVCLLIAAATEWITFAVAALAMSVIALALDIAEWRKN